DGRDLLEECLPSVTAEVERYGRGSETIVVDDASADGSAEFLRERFPGVRVLALEKNAGFGAASDAGIRAARSDLVLLLNSDITMEPGSLDPLVETIASAPGAFAVQPRTLFPEGGLNFGVNMGRLERGYPRFWNEADIPGAPRVDSLFPTLYCLGGAMLFDRRKYEALGGFDPLFHPFRWEDIDLCYRARKRGWDCLYQPASRMVHKHHATLNRVFTPDYLNVIETRNEILFAWKNLTEPILVDEHLRALPGLVAAHLLAGRGNFARGLLRALPRLPAALRGRRRERRAACRSDRIAMNPPLRRYRNFRRGGERKRPQILVLNPVFPYPPIDGGKHRVYNVLKAAAEENDIHLLCFADRGSEPEIGAMREFCASVETVPFPADFGYLGPKREALFPMYYRNYCSPEMEAKLRAALKEKPIDVVQVETDKMLFYAGSVDSLPVVYVDQDVAGLFDRGGKNPPHRGWRRAIDVFEWLRTVRWETVEGRRCWTVVTVSEEDEEILRRLLPGADVRSVRHGTCVEEFYAPYREVEENSLLYVGSFGHYPNVEAVEYLIGEVWPLIRREVPDATLTVVGSHPTPEILARGGRDGIEVTGFVESVRPYLDRAAVFVAPMRKGMGMKGKVLEAMVRGKPVVTTSIGIRGAAVEPG
ncbi:MAG TPA: glycosyltransferase, partial [bacterium]|nr:glycosyltransferase [bacterium]